MEIVVFSCAIIALGILSIKEHKKGNNDMIPLVYWALMTSCLVFLTIYILDKFNLPTKWGWSHNLDSKNWLGFLGSFLTGILTTIVNALFLIGITIIQINNNRKDSFESLRIQNMPILKYDINDNNYNVGMFDSIWTDGENKVPYTLNISIKNVGSNTIRNLKVDVEHNIKTHRVQRIIGNERNRMFGKRRTIYK